MSKGVDRAPVVFMAVGDIILGDPPDPEALFAPSAPMLAEADLLFGQNETSYSERGALLPQARGRVRYHPRNIPALAKAGFDVMSVCGNHAVDYGHDALIDTINGLRDAGIATAGAGRTEAEARDFPVLDRNGVKVAVLAYSPASDKSYNATPVRPGNVPMAVYTYYHEAQADFPGAAARTFTFPDPDHVAALRADVQRAKAAADVVVVSFHWGLPFEPVTLASYESELGKIAIDSGADLIVGHHQHMIKAVEVYKGRVIFHGINRFLLWIQLPPSHFESPVARAMAKTHGENYLAFDPASANPFPAQSNSALVVRAELTKQGVGEVAFIPCTLDAVTAVPRRAAPGDGDFERIVAYTQEVTEQVGFSTRFEVIGDRVRVMC